MDPIFEALAFVAGRRKLMSLSPYTMDQSNQCSGNCSGHGVCLNGSCYCHIKFEGSECKRVNFSYHVAFTSIFFLLALTSLIQLVMCIHAEYLRMKKHPSILRACKITTQKFLYFLVFVAALLRGVYFAAPTVGNLWSTSLLSAYYPVVLTGTSLIVCFWAEVFHLREIRWDRPRFLSKSFVGFVVFNVVSYSLLLAELILVGIEHEDREFYAHIFNGCYAILMFIVVIFFLIYGVEVFFKVRGGFAVPRVPQVITSRQIPSSDQEQARGDIKGPDNIEQKSKDEIDTLLPIQSISNVQADCDHSQLVNTSQLHQSRLGLLSQALMMIITVGFLFSETLEEFWKTKVDLSSRNTHDIVFRTIEIGIALWFPCVLWNCIRPEQLWCLNPKKILEKFPPLKDVRGSTPESQNPQSPRRSSESTDDEDKGPECWICYDNDRTDAGPMIHPCNCRGDVGAVHHDCLRRWLVESADNPEALQCKVCSANYMVEKGSQFSLTQGFTTKQWLQTASFVTIMCLSVGGCWAVIQIYTLAWIRLIAVSATLLIQYICLRSLGLNTLTAYQRAKVQALKIVNLRIGGNASQRQRTLSEAPVLQDVNQRRSSRPGVVEMVQLEVPEVAL